LLASHPASCKLAMVAKKRSYKNNMEDKEEDRGKEEKHCLDTHTNVYNDNTFFK